MLVHKYMLARMYILHQWTTLNQYDRVEFYKKLLRNSLKLNPKRLPK
jgi:hypothetical protein